MSASIRINNEVAGQEAPQHSAERTGPHPPSGLRLTERPRPDGKEGAQQRLWNSVRRPQRDRQASHGGARSRAETRAMISPCHAIDLGEKPCRKKGPKCCSIDFHCSPAASAKRPLTLSNRWLQGAKQGKADAARLFPGASPACAFLPAMRWRTLPGRDRRRQNSRFCGAPGRTGHLEHACFQRFQEWARKKIW